MPKVRVIKNLMESDSNLKSNMGKDISPLTAKRILILIIILAAVLRLWGILHGYPYSYYPDEAHFVKRSLAFGSGDLNPHWFHKPAFYMYLLFFEYGLIFLVGRIVGYWHSVSDFGIYYIKNPGLFYLIGRITTSMFSVASIVITYFAAKELFNRKVGLISALMLALSFGHVMVAKDVKADTPCMFFTIVSVCFLIRYMKHRRIKYIILSSIFAGVGTATKQYSIVMLISIFFALISGISFENIRDIIYKFRILLLCLLSFYFIYFICSPYNFIDPLGRKSTFGSIYSLTKKVGSVFTGSKAEDQISKENISEDINSPKTSFAVFKKSLFSYVNELYKGMGLILLLLILFGLIYIFKNLNQNYFVFLLFLLLFSLISILLAPGYSEIRHQIVIYPFLIICGALFFARILDNLINYSGLGYLLLLVLLVPMYQIINYDIFISKKDTRNIAKSWIETHIAAGTKILIEDGELNLSPGKKHYEEILERARKTEKSQFTFHAETFYKLSLEALPKINYDIAYIRNPWWQQKEPKTAVYYALTDYDIDMANPLKPAGIMSYEYYKKNGYQYAITSSEKYLNFQEGSQRAKTFPSFYKFYKELYAQGVLVKEFRPDERPGPIIKIFRID